MVYYKHVVVLMWKLHALVKGDVNTNTKFGDALNLVSSDRQTFQLIAGLGAQLDGSTAYRPNLCL